MTAIPMADKEYEERFEQLRHDLPLFNSVESIYVSGPYSSDSETMRLENIRLADETGREIARRGFIPFVPHLMPGAWDSDEVLTWDDCMAIDLYFLRKCDAILLLPGWQASKGAKIEHQEAERRGILILESIDQVPDRRRQHFE